MLAYALLLGALFCAQDAAPTVLSSAFAYDIIQKYNRFNDATTLSLDIGIVWHDGENSLELDFDQFYFGTGRSRPMGGPSFRLFNRGRKGWHYLDYHPVSMIVDGERYSFETEHKGKVKDGGIEEWVWVNISESLLRKLAKSSKWEMKFGRDEFSISDSRTGALQEFVAFIDDPTRTMGSQYAKTLLAQAEEMRKEYQDEEALTAYRRVVSGASKSAEAADASRAIKELSNPATKEARARKRQALNDATARKAVQTKIDQKLRLARNLEKYNAKAAATYYKEAVGLADSIGLDTGDVKTARERLRALGSN
jgi:hypothetical protein